MTENASRVAKNRTSCRQCKIKRLKCDEAVPACTNCLKRGWQCPGYGKHIRWSTKHERFGTSVPTSQASHGGGTTTQESPHSSLAQVTPNITGTELHSPTTVKYGGSIGLQRMDDYELQGPISGFDDFDYSTLQLDGDTPERGGLQKHHINNSHGANYDQTSLSVPHTHSIADTQSEESSDPASSACNSTISRQSAQKSSFDPAIFYTPTHLPTILIEYWFSDICPMWSIFDSDANYNRRFASMSWASSEPVFFAMQSMSAACLLDTLPTLTPVLSSLTTKALSAIKRQVSSFQETRRAAPFRFPTDLLFAIFAMGTSLHWKYGYELGGLLIKDAGQIISHYKGQLPAMSVLEREQLAFFQKALICWEGLLSAADRDFFPNSFAARRNAIRSRLLADQTQVASQQLTFGPAQIPLSDVELHPWCGVSSDVLQNFGQVLSLCHLARRRQRSTAGDVDLESRCDIGFAHELAWELAAMDFTSDRSGSSADRSHPATNDNDTPYSHLLAVAEAYRQACFLQLCLTFEDIPIHPKAHPSIGLAVSESVDLVTENMMTRVQGLVGLSLQLVDQLKNIPPESGSRCMQPVLYLCVASGLRLCSPPQLENDDTESLSHVDIPHELTQQLGLETTIIVSTLKVAQARSFVKKRLGMLQHLLPPRYTRTALRLAVAIWAEYDRTESGGRPLYWFDVMVREKLQTFFG